MPTYVYECKSCNKTYEIQQRITENALTVCPCGVEGMFKRVIQPIAVMFKGEGFHINDYAPKATEAADSSPKSEPAAATSTPPVDTAPRAADSTPAPSPVSD